jgi:nucleotide-binding universal stress UspA family protein
MKFKPSGKPGGLKVELKPGETQLPFEAAAKYEPLPVFNLRRILVPVDFSECSKKALLCALPLARQFDASIVLLHVVQPYIPVPEMSTMDVGLLEVELRGSATKQLAALQQSVSAEVPVETELRVGNPHVEIIDAVRRLSIDLIVLATHGRTGLAHVFMGSVAERVVRHATCPVLVVREREPEFLSSSVSESGTDQLKAAGRTSRSSASSLSLKKTAVILALVAAIAASFSVGMAQSKRQRATKEFMREKLELSQKALEGLVTEDYGLIEAKAQKLSAMSKEADWRVFENPDYDQQSIAFRRQVSALASAAKQRNLDAATLAYVRMTMSCVDCHKFVRGKLVASATGISAQLPPDSVLRN